MSRPKHRSKQTRLVLSALLESDPQWRYGYDVCKQANLKSGTLYPILIRLADDGYLDTQWEDQPAPGRPPRHLYRLTASGRALAMAAQISPQTPNKAQPC